MKKILKWIGIVTGGLISLILLTSLILYPIGRKKLTRSYPDIPVESVRIPTDSNAIERGRHISIIWACTKCHGEDLGGRLITRDPIGGTIPTLGSIPASNLTPGRGGIGRYYTDVDWIRSIRHGVKPNNKPAIFMYVTNLSDQDLGDLITYLKHIPAINSDSSAIKYGPIIPIACALGIFPPVAGSIDHQAQHPADPAPGATIEYGKYLYSICAGCHYNSILKNMKKWNQKEFTNTFQTGILPNGKSFGRTMSSKTFREMNEMELSALWLYIRQAH
jgi:cytochrome c553